MTTPEGTAASPPPPHRTGERPADIDAFVRRHGQSLMRYAWLLTRGDEAASQDLVQTALVKMIAHGYDQIDHPSAFARRLMTNQHHDQGRHQQVHRRTLPRLAGAEEVLRDATSAVEDRDELFAALGHLSPRERTVVVLRYYEDHDDATIADVVGCTRSTVRSLARRGLATLHRHLEHTGGDADVGRPRQPARRPGEEHDS